MGKYKEIVQEYFELMQSNELDPHTRTMRMRKFVELHIHPDFKGDLLFGTVELGSKEEFVENVIKSMKMYNWADNVEERNYEFIEESNEDKSCVAFFANEKIKLNDRLTELKYSHLWRFRDGKLFRLAISVSNEVKWNLEQNFAYLLSLVTNKEDRERVNSYIEQLKEEGLIPS